MENGKWKMEHGKSSLFIQKRRHRWVEAVCFLLPERATFSAPRRRQRLGRYVDRNENFVLAWPACGGAGALRTLRSGALRTLENARRSARSTRDIKGEALV
jgi:hypothetical protein